HLSLSLRETGRRLPENAGAASEHQWPLDRWRWNRHRVPYLFQLISTLGPPGADRKTMFSDGCSFESTRTSSSIFSFNSPPNRSSKASKVQSTSRRDLRRVKLARTIWETLPKFRQKSKGSHRNTRDPPPGHSKPPHHHVRGDSAEISAEV
ncbi:hypothetical protein Prudu_013902, partial [Prunus dulcis]